MVSGKPTRDEKEQKKVFLQLLALLVARNPGEVNELLVKHDLTKVNGLSDKALVNLSLAGIVSGNVAFHKGLGRLLSGLSQTLNPEEAYMAEESGEDHMNPLSMITGTIGSVANIIGNAQQVKMQKAQARNATMENLLAFKAQQKAATERQRQEKAQADQRKKLILIIAVTLMAGLVIVLAYSNRKAPADLQLNPQTN